LISLLNGCFTSLSGKSLSDQGVEDDLKTIDFCVQQLYFTLLREKETKNDPKTIEQNKVQYYLRIRDILSLIVERSKGVHGGFMVAHTGFYFIQLLIELFSHEPEFMLSLAVDIVDCAAANSFTYDSSTMAEIIKLSEMILTDPKELLNDPLNFKKLLAILDHFANSGWQEALELTWRLKDIF
jgi:hypothetical protein